jgi:hypothetical protein
MKAIDRARQRQDDEGAILVVALAFLLLFALFIPALLGSTQTGISVSQSLNTQRRDIYAAEAGLRTNVEALRNSRTTAVYNQPCGPTVVGTFNGVQVRVRCDPQPSSGDSGLTRPPFALLALPHVDSTTEGVTDTPTVGGGGGTSDVYVGGDVSSNGFIKRAANSASGHFYISGTAEGHSCVGGNIDDPATGNNVCTVVSTVFADPGLTNTGYAKSGGFPAATDPAAICMTNAAKFLPGYYTHMPSAPGACASKTWWFSPGLYYFDFTSGTHVLDLSSQTVVTGTPNPTNYDPASGSAAPVMPGSCKVDGDLPPYTGTEWIFGADTVLNVGAAAKIELCPTVSDTSQEISLRGYGAAGDAPSGVTTVTDNPTSNTQSPSTAYKVAAVDTGPNAYAIGGALATGVVNSSSSSDITMSGFPDVPTNAVVTKAVLRIKHQETSSGTGNPPTIGATVVYKTGTAGTDVPLGCATGQLCASSTQRLDTVDVTAGYQSTNGASVSQMTVDFGVNSPRNTVTTEALDGIELDITYAPSGVFRLQTGCTVLPVGAAGQCDTLSNDPGAQLYVQGTIYAPLGRIDIATASGDPVQLNRGVIARDIIGAIHPGNGSANPFGIGRPDRLALLTAEVSTNGVDWTPTIESLVRFDDNVATSTTRGRVTYLSWHVIR